MSSLPEVSIFWFRRDLRLHDNVGLYYALKESKAVLPIFIFDTQILTQLQNPQDVRVNFIYSCVEYIQGVCKEFGSSLYVLYGNPIDVFSNLISQFSVVSVYANRDYEPYGIKRDASVELFLTQNGIAFYTFKDHVIFEQDEVVKQDGNPYTVYTPYAKTWKMKFSQMQLQSYTSEQLLSHLFKTSVIPIPSLDSIGFSPTSVCSHIPQIPVDCIQNYHKTRDFPAIEGTSQLGVHLRFGTVSIRELVCIAIQHNHVWLNELIWREFFSMILYHFPQVVHANFKSQYDSLQWINNEEHFQRWCDGETGYPIVDAGMRQLNETGFMHNRVRMITASFLCKHLLIDWQWGEAYFAQKLIDYELSSNNGNWQWAASTGCDAVPYFRIFNPYEQTKRFDAEYLYIQKWVPNYNSSTYIKPIVEHSFARQRALQTYKKCTKF
ncbi:MAG TPA: deoxyribodipyrimidine photo-lyase [Bacteroidales bacterium]|jgi:deoxyribodipyrimidine photo-lyase|nr:deoxyribodipyrimidine photo-lyase [Bacteroidales bacterium]HRS18124.1 deoxyribodipyrimidine photo-lyase [Bacteroidales bacterium]